MNPEFYDRAKALFQEALGKSRSERRVFIDTCCAGDEQLRKEVESWLAASDQAGSFLEGHSAKLCTDCNVVFPVETCFCPHCGQVVEDDPRALVGTRLDNLYQIEDLLGRGGMGAVYKAKHVLLGDRVAIKTLRKELSDNPTFIKRFQREGRAARAFQHPNAVTVYDLRTTPAGLIYMVLEYIEGHTLRDEMTTFGPFSVLESIELLEPLASVLDAAHKAGVVHRDLKPDNVMVSRDDSGQRVLKVLDLGIAKLREIAAEQPLTNLTVAGHILGTPHYMSPEQWGVVSRDGGLEIDGRGDVYSLGVIAYELLTGVWPYTGASIQELKDAHLNRTAQSPHKLQPGVPKAISKAVKHALAKDRVDRTPTARQFLEELRAASPAGDSGAFENSPDDSVPSSTSELSGVDFPVLGSDDETIVGSARSKASSSPSPPTLATESALLSGDSRSIDVQTPPSREPLLSRRASAISGVSPPRARVLMVVGIAILLVIAGVGLAARYSSGNSAPSQPGVPEVSPVSSAAARRTVVSFYAEIESADRQVERATGLDPIAAGNGMRFHFSTTTPGYFAVVAPGKENAPTLFEPADRAGLIEDSRELVFPSSGWLKMKEGSSGQALTVVYAPSLAELPSYLRSGSSRPLSEEEQRNFQMFVGTHSVGSDGFDRVSDGEPLVRVSAPRVAGAIAFDVRILTKREH